MSNSLRRNARFSSRPSKPVINARDGCWRDGSAVGGNVGLECPCPSLGNLLAPLLPDRQGEEHEPPDNLREHESAKRQLGYQGYHDSAASIIGTSKLSSSP